MIISFYINTLIQILHQPQKSAQLWPYLQWRWSRLVMYSLFYNLSWLNLLACTSLLWLFLKAALEATITYPAINCPKCTALLQPSVEGARMPRAPKNRGLRYYKCTVGNSNKLCFFEYCCHRHVIWWWSCCLLTSLPPCFRFWSVNYHQYVYRQLLNMYHVPVAYICLHRSFVIYAWHIDKNVERAL